MAKVPGSEAAQVRVFAQRPGHPRVPAPGKLASGKRADLKVPAERPKRRNY